MSGPRRLRRLARRVASAALLLLGCASPALAGRLSEVRVGQLAVRGRLHQEAWVSVLDAEGLPVAGLEARDFAAREDGRPTAVLEARTFAAAFARATWIVLVDPELLGPDARGALGSLVAGIGRDAGARDRLRLVSLGPGAGAVEGSAAEAAALVGRLSSGPTRPAETALYDVLYREVRRAARAGGGEARVVWLVTRGADAGSGRRPAEVLAAARAGGRQVPICVLLLEAGASVADLDRFAALAKRSGGSLVRVTAPAELAAQGQRLLASIRGAYRLRFDLPLPASGASRHELEVTARQGAAAATGELAFDPADVVATPWWQATQTWLLPLALLVVALAAFLVLRPRRLCRLVVQTGEEKGCSYEVFGLPVTLGAAANNDIVLPDGRVSRSHAQLESRARRVELVDLNSENGTFVNGARVQRRPLERGDRVSLGGAVELRFEG